MYGNVLVAADAMTTDTVVVYIILPDNTAVPAIDAYGNVATLTTTKPMVNLFGGPVYGFTKVGTTDTVALYWSPVLAVTQR